jgi:hypothetical protein
LFIVDFAIPDSASPSSSTTPNTKPTETMKVTIKKWNAVATWGWDLPEDDVCGICQVHFDGTCPACKYPGDDCKIRKLFLLHIPLVAIPNLSIQDQENVVTTFIWYC